MFLSTFLPFFLHFLFRFGKKPYICNENMLHGLSLYAMRGVTESHSLRQRPGILTE